MHYIIFDMEWNQAFSAEKMVKHPVVLRGEIIQIGAVKLNEQKEVTDTCNLIIKPKFYKKMHWSVSKLTHIKTADLKNGSSFAEAILMFQKFIGDDSVLCTWGPDDMGMLWDNLRVHGISAEWLPKSYDLQMIYDMEIAKINRQAALEEAMEFLNEEILPSHDALNDALNTARVCRYLNLPEVFENYEQREKEYECRLTGADEVYHSEQEYENRDKALENEELLSFICPKCGEKGKLSGVIYQNGNKYLAVGTCANKHGYMARLRISKDHGDGVYAVRYLYELTEERNEYYLAKKKRYDEKQKKFTEHLLALKKQQRKAP